MTIDALNQDLDALPLPEPALHVAFSDDGEHIRFWTRYAQSAAVWAAENWPTERVYSEAQYRAARREGYELAMRKAVTVEAALKVITDAMRTDPEYAWSWHCNIAMAFVDEGGDHAMANHAAARFMKLLANVEPAHELPERKDQEGLEPVGVVYTMQALSSLEFDGGPPKCHVSLYEDLPAGTKLYAPPPKSDEAMDALIKAARWFADNPDSPKSALGHITEALAALAAQQKGGEA